MPQIGPYIIHEIINKNLCILKNGEKILKTKHLLKNIKTFYEPKLINSSPDRSIDIECVQTLQVQDQTRYFNPVGKHWQRAKCRALRLEYKRSLESDVKIKVLSHPYKIQKIIGDGNCLFRAFSYAVTGTEEQHLTIRQNIVTVI